MYIPFDTVDRIGFVSTRFSGTDGVSLETKKWADVFEKHKLDCYYFAGELDRDTNHSFKIEQAHFKHPDIRDVYQKLLRQNDS